MSLYWILLDCKLQAYFRVIISYLAILTCAYSFLVLVPEGHLILVNLHLVNT